MVSRMVTLTCRTLGPVPRALSMLVADKQRLVALVQNQQGTNEESETPERGNYCKTTYKIQ